MAVKTAERLAPFNKSVLDAAEFYAAHLERERGSVLVSAAIEGVFERKSSSGTCRNVMYVISAVALAGLTKHLGRGS